jgi:hypothetical protein
MATENALGDMALAYAKRGLHVFPCQPRGKVPACARGVSDATTDHNLIAKWWDAIPDCNIGAACGEKSGIFVVAIDAGEAEAALAQLEKLHGALPPTVESITPRGRHAFFSWPDRVVKNSASKVGPNIDVRGQGGYVLVPPSIHPSGRPYAWSVDSASIFAAAPDWLLDLIAAKPAPRSVTPPEQWRELAQGVSKGARNCSLACLAGLLLRRRIDAVVVLALLQGFNARDCSPPLPEEDVCRIVDSICGREFQRRNNNGQGCGQS